MDILKAYSGFWPRMLPEISWRLYREEAYSRSTAPAYSGQRQDGRQRALGQP